MKNGMQLSTQNALADMLRYIPAIAIPSVMGVVSISVFTRLLSPYEYGLYILVFTAALFVETLGFSWLNQSTLRYFQRYGDKSPVEFFSTSIFGFLALILVVAFAAFCVLFLLRNYSYHKLWKLALLGPLLLFAQSGYQLTLTLLRAQRESWRYSLQASGNAILRFLCALALISFFAMKAEAILLGMSCAGGFVFLLEIVRLCKRFQISIHRLSLRLFRTFARYGFPLVGLAAANMILSASDRYLIEYFSDSAQVGIYSAGYRIAETSVYLFVSFLLLAAFPALIEVFEKQGEDRTRELMKDLLSIFLLLIVPVVFGISALSEEITEVLLGKLYFQAHIVLPWVSVGIFFMGLSMYFNKSFELKERTIIVLSILAVASCLNIALNLMLIPALGILGAAVATCLSYFCSLSLSIIVGSRFIRWAFPWRIALKTILGSILMVAIIIMLPQLRLHWASLVFKIGAGFGAYVFFIAIFEKRLLSLTYQTVGKRSVFNRASS
jgi:O-antigen/teichoic acid export membrane protein